MEPKKNPVHDVHRHRSLLFTIGLATSLLIVITAFELGFKVTRDTPAPSLPPIEEVFTYVIPTEHVYQKPRPKLKPSPVTLATIIPVVDVTANNDEYPEVEDPELFNTDFAIPTVVMPEEKHKEPFIFVEEMPEPVGGTENFYAILKANLKYPRVAERRHIQGKVFVEFVVNEAGQADDFRVLKGIGSGCDEEAIRVLKLVKWKPGKQRGVAVKVRMVQPVYFKLN